MNTTTQTLPDGTWALDPATTNVTVTVKKMKAITVPATLTVSSGNITITNGAVSNVAISLDAHSYNSPSKKRNEHVVSNDFLDAESFPAITFSADNHRSISDGHRVAGQVHIKGKSTPLSFDVTNLRIDGESASFSATATADRFDLGVSKLPAIIIAKQLDISVTAKAAQQS